MSISLRPTPTTLERLAHNPRVRTAAGVALIALAIVGTMAVPSAAPHLFKVLYKLYRSRKRSKPRDLAAIQSKRIFFYLKRTGAVRFHRNGSEWFVSITRAGQKRLQRLGFDALVIPKPKRWDKKWWLVAADIPTKGYKIAADNLRRKLVQVGFKPLQRTLWIHPYDPRKEVEEIISHYGVERFVTIMEINRLDIQDEKLLKYYFRKRGVL